MRHLIVLVPVLTVAFTAVLPPAPGRADETGYLCDTVSASPAYPGKLPAGTVCMRSLVPRSAKPDDPRDTLQAIRDFHVNRLEWTYSLTKDFVRQAQALGCTASGAAANSTLAGLDKSSPDWYRTVSAVDLDGNPVEAPWMRPWPGHTLWHCVNNPVARQAYLSYVRSLVDVGTTDIQRDDPSMNEHATSWGGCFCRYCREGFREYLRRHGDPAKLQESGVASLDGFDYGEYLKARGAPVGDAFRQYPRDYLKGLFLDYQSESTLEFHRWWREELNRYAGRVVPVTANNGVSAFTPLYLLFDGFIGELNYAQAEPEALYEAARRCRELNKGLTVTMPLLPSREKTPEWVRRIRQTIATAYALGMHIEAPWDTYLPTSEATPARYFGEPQESADLFGLVRACTPLLDGYEEAAVDGGVLLEPSEGQGGPVSTWSRDGRLCAVTRAQPRRRDAPLVVHLVDWSSEPSGSTISLDPLRLFGGRPYRVTLITPRPYEAAAHGAAERQKRYEGLIERSVLGSGKLTTFSLPALRPWGLLLLEPLPAQAGPWPPWFASEETGGLIVRAEPGATVRYTTDGAEPGERSARYSATLPPAGAGELRARAWLGRQPSAVSTLPGLPRSAETPRQLLSNGSFREGAEGWRPVVALPDGQALEFTIVPRSPLGERPAAQLKIRSSDGVPYHLRLVQPCEVPSGSRVRLRATLVADRPAHVRLGLQEISAPYRTVAVRELDLTSEPQQVSLSAFSSHPDLRAQFQLDLGSVQAPTTVWMTEANVRCWQR